LRGMLRQAHARGTTLIMTTHDMAQGFELCRRALVLVRGRLVWNGPIQEDERSSFERTYSSVTHQAQGDVATRGAS